MVRVPNPRTIPALTAVAALAAAMAFWCPAPASAGSRKSVRVGVVADRDLACVLDDGCAAVSAALPRLRADEEDFESEGLSLRVVSAPARAHGRRTRRLFLYRLDLGPERASNGGCVDSVSFDAGPLAGGIDVDGDGKRGERAVVIASETEVAPARVARIGRVLRFEFSPALCPGGGALHDGRSTEFGWMSYRKPGLIHSDLSTRAGAVTIPIWGPKRNSKSVLFDKIKLEVPSRIPEGCGPTPVDDPGLLDCWLQVHEDVQADLTWKEEPPAGAILPWLVWPEERKADVRAAFLASWAWAEGGFQSYGGPTIGEPPTNQLPIVDGAAIRTVVTADEGWDFYAAYLGHALAAEIFAWVPWSITNLEPAVRATLLKAETLVVYHESLGGYAFTSLRSTPAHPVTVYDFLRASNLIGPTQADTVARLLDWSRAHMRHFSGPYNVANLDAHWGYLGPPPVSLVIDGTIRSGYGYPTDPEPTHWTAACSGTSDFLREVLRVVNIPAIRVTEPCGHMMPYFPTLKAYLSHGDDLYDALAKGDPTFPAKDFLVDEATWVDWFIADPSQACANVGRRPIELSVFWLPDALVSHYCQDVLAGLDHASGSVASILSPAYDLAELEAMDLWTQLAAKANPSIYPCNYLP